MTKAEFAQLMGCEKTVIGMVHLLPLPGSPRYGGSMRAVFEAALRDLKALEGAGVKAAIIENFGDVPYGTENEFITLACMTSVAAQLRERTTMKLGINVQYNCAVEEWGMAYASGANFIRVEAFVETRVGTHGITYPAAPALMREKGRYPAPTLLFCDVNTKHTEPLVPVPIADSIHEAIEEGADALIVTGVVTGQNPTLEPRSCWAAGSTRKTPPSSSPWRTGPSSAPASKRRAMSGTLWTPSGCSRSCGPSPRRAIRYRAL